jgi:hypothetical protein
VASHGDGRQCGLRQLAVHSNSDGAEGASVEAAKPARTLRWRGRGGDTEVGGTARCRRQCAVPSWGHGGGRHGAVPAAVRGPVVGPACRACADESERARRKNISVGTVHDGLFQGQWCEYFVVSRG